MLEDNISPDPGTHTYKEVCDQVKAGAAAFQKLGVLPGSCVAVFAENSHKWLLTEQAGGFFAFSFPFLSSNKVFLLKFCNLHKTKCILMH